MREFKFRAWYKEPICEMIYFDNISCEPTDDGNPKMVFFSDHPKTYLCSADVMQYTGLKDKNGKEIYEGDIITYDSLMDINGYGLGVIEWYKAWFTVDFIGSFRDVPLSPEEGSNPCEYCGMCKYRHWSLNMTEECEVIGNIHQDIHLLDNTERKGVGLR